MCALAYPSLSGCSSVTLIASLLLVLHITWPAQVHFILLLPIAWYSFFLSFSIMFISLWALLRSPSRSFVRLYSRFLIHRLYVVGLTDSYLFSPFWVQPGVSNLYPSCILSLTCTWTVSHVSFLNSMTKLLPISDFAQPVPCPKQISVMPVRRLQFVGCEGRKGYFALVLCVSVCPLMTVHETSIAIHQLQFVSAFQRVTYSLKQKFLFHRISNH